MVHQRGILRGHFRVAGWGLVFCLLGGLPSAWAGQKKWTDTPDWASTKNSKDVTWTEVQGQIQLIKNPPRNISTPYIYIPNSVSDNVTQLSTQNRPKTGRFRWILSSQTAIPLEPPLTSTKMSGLDFAIPTKSSGSARKARSSRPNRKTPTRHHDRLSKQRLGRKPRR